MTPTIKPPGIVGIGVIYMMKIGILTLSLSLEGNEILGK